MKDLIQELMLFKKLVINGDLIKNTGIYKNYWQKKMPQGSNFYKNKTCSKLNSEANIVADHYKDTHIEYIFNENGYRIFTPESFENIKDEIFCFGCSFTFGFALPEDHTWPYILGKKTNMKPINYGVGGVSVDFIARQIYQIINTIPKEKYPKHVFVFFPEIFRKEFLINDEDKIYYHRFITNVSRNTAEKSKTEAIKRNFKPEYVDAYFDGNSIVSLFFDFVKNFHFIDSVLKSKNISWSWSSYSNFYHLPKHILEAYLDTNTFISKDGHAHILDYRKYETARDGTHKGKEYMEDVASIFAQAYTSSLFQKTCQEKLNEENKSKIESNVKFNEIDFKKNLEDLAKDQDFIYE